MIIIINVKFYTKNLDKALLFTRNQVFCLKNWKLWWASTTLKFNIFCWNFAHVSYLPISTKGCSCSFILVTTWVICKNKKMPGSYTLVFYILINNSRSKQNNINVAHPFVEVVK